MSVSLSEVIGTSIGVMTSLVRSFTNVTGAHRKTTNVTWSNREAWHSQVEKKEDTVWCDVWCNQGEVTRMLDQWTVDDKIVSLMQIVSRESLYSVNTQAEKCRLSATLKCIVDDFPLKISAQKSKEVVLYRETKTLNYRTWELAACKKEIETLLANEPDFVINGCLPTCTRSLPVFEIDGSITFTRSLHEWPISANVSIFLLKKKKNEELVWYLFNKKNNRAQVDTVNIPDTVSRAAHISYAIAHRVIIRPDGPTMMPFPKSSMDKTKTITFSQWVVSLVDTGRSYIFDPKRWFGHGGIVIEGMESDGSQFRHFVHLRKTDKAVVLFEENRVFAENTKVLQSWERPSRDVQSLIKRVKWEIQKQKEGNPQVFFDIRGSHAIGVKPQKTNREYDSYEEWMETMKTVPGREMEQQFTRDFFFSKTDLAEDLSYKPNLLDIGLLIGASTLPNPISSFLSSLLVCKLKGPEDQEFRNWEKFGEKHLYSRFIRKNPATKKIEEFIMPDSCITWGVKKLYLAGIKLPPSKFPSIGTVPSNYA